MGVDEVVVCVFCIGICGIDLYIFCWDEWVVFFIVVLLVFGYEFYGEVVEVGFGVYDIVVGDCVFGEGYIVCGICCNCWVGWW